MKTQSGEILRVYPVQAGKRFNVPYHTVTFLMDDWTRAELYLVPTFLNFKAWRPLLKEGQWIAGLEVDKTRLINGDSKVRSCDPATRPPLLRPNMAPASNPKTPQLKLL